MEWTIESVKSKTGRFIQLEEGKPVEFVIAKIEDIPDTQFHFSHADYKTQITTTDGRVRDITAWSELTALSAALLKANKIKGVKVRAKKLGRGKYEYELLGVEEIEEKEEEVSEEVPVERVED